MKGARWLAAAAFAFVALSVAAFLALGGPVAADSSALSRGARGWLVARRYLEAKGTRVRLLDRPLSGIETAPLVLALPWQRLPSEDRRVLKQRLARGGLVAFGYSGSPLDFGESWVAEALDLSWRRTRGQPPLLPWRWRRFASREWDLTGAPGAEVARGRLRIRAPARVPVAPRGADVLSRGPDGVPIVFRYRVGPGEVFVFPAEALANARLDSPAHVDLLETLRRRLGESCVLDEFHHGLSAPQTAAGAGPRRSLDLYLIHLAFAYVLGVFALSRRFGPVWREAPVIAGATGLFLTGLGGLHHRLGHHAAAARQLVARARELDPRLELPAGVDAEAARADASGLIEIARRVARAQKRGSE